MTEYSPPLEDIRFALRHFGMLDRTSQSERYSHADYDTVSMVLEEHGRFHAEVWAPTDPVGDTQGLTWTPEGVQTPEVFEDAWKKFVEGGWQAFVFDQEYGGMGFPEVAYQLSAEVISGSNASLAMLPGLTTGAGQLLQQWGTEEQKELYLRKLVTGEWSGTMNLTEPQAGSDVGLSTTRAVPQDDGSYLITGTKIFISFGEHDLSGNIVHLVLARTPDAPAGTRGISLFIVPKYLPDDDGRPGERNDVTCVSIEHKMGIHGSPTCVMSFGDHGGAVGWLVGEENQGLRAMFTMMNAARLAVGVQSTGIAYAGYQKAARYATERVQGREVGSDVKDAVAIERHPDVRRMLLSMRSQIEAMRNLTTYNAACIDMAEVTEGEESERWEELVELLTPLSKAWCTERGVEVNSTAVQVFGGMGFIEESGVARHYRDQRITPIYEGTNGIQGMDLVGRKLGLRMGGVMADHMARMREVLPGLAEAGLGGIHDSLTAALDELQKATDWVMAHGLEDPRDALAGASPYLEMFGLANGGWLMARQALAALEELEAGGDEAFLRAKVTTARFFCEQMLPKVMSLGPAVTGGAGVLYEIEADTLTG